MGKSYLILLGYERGDIESISVWKARIIRIRRMIFISGSPIPF